MLPIFPLEIEEIILDLLAEDDEGHPALEICSLVCQAFLPICRKHLFRTIVLNKDFPYSYPSPTAHEFACLLRKTPKIADYVRQLKYVITIRDLTNKSIQESLKQISRLEFLSVALEKDSDTRREVVDWSDNPIRPALLHLLHLPTLTRLKMDYIRNFVVSDLIPCVNLKYLHIGNCMYSTAENTFPATLPDHPIRLNEFVSNFDNTTVIMKLCTARRPDGLPIIDFESLPKLTVGVAEYEEEVSQELFRRCHSLTNAHIRSK